MDLRELRELVRRGESSTLEFKLKANHPEKIVREVVAFANTDGGTLLVGVGDDRSIPGLKFADDEEYTLVRAIEKFCTPEIRYDLERLPVEGDREVLIFRIPSSEGKPHYVSIDPTGSDRKAYVRVQDKSVQASKEVRQILKWKGKARNVTFNYGHKEDVLMKYLAEHPSVTVEVFAQVARIPQWLASKTLITLTLASVLRIRPDEAGDRFVMA